MSRHWTRRLGLAGVLGAAAMLCLWAVPARAGGDKVEEGKPAPKVALPATSIASVFPDRKDAKSLDLADFKGKKNVVLWFYPKALTGG